MRKIALLLIVALVLGISVMAYAGPTKYTLTLTQGDGAVGTESGVVILNFPKLPGPDMDDFGIIIGRFQVRGLNPNLDYWVYSQENLGEEFELKGKVKVNKRGFGHFVAMTNEAWQDPAEDSFYLGIVNDENPTDVNVVLSAEALWP